MLNIKKIYIFTSSIPIYLSTLSFFPSWQTVLQLIPALKQEHAFVEQADLEEHSHASPQKWMVTSSSFVLIYSLISIPSGTPNSSTSSRILSILAGFRGLARVLRRPSTYKLKNHQGSQGYLYQMYHTLRLCRSSR